MVIMAMVIMAMVVMAMVMMAMAMGIIVSESLRQVGWLCQHQHPSFHRLRAIY
jgi:hypothetical protein